MPRFRRVALALVGLLLAGTAAAHETRPGYLEIRETAPDHYDILWKRPVGGEVPVDLVPVFPDACTDPGGARLQQGSGAAILRIALDCEGGLRGQTVGVEGLAGSITDVLLRVVHADGVEETHLLRPTSPTAVIGGVTGWARITSYLRLGIQHILLGVDHLLFVLGLLLIVGNRRTLVKTITAFTVAHSITLGIATLGYASAPILPLNAVIALSILFLGPEIVRARRGGTSLTIRHPWVVAFAFGLLHGFGFATGLTELGLPRQEIPLALFLFNVGVEIGQLGFVALVLLLERSFRVLEIVWPRPVRAIPAYTVGTLGAFWFLQRTAILLGSLS